MILLSLCIQTKAESQQYFSYRIGLGAGKIQYYDSFHPVFLSGPGNEDLRYSPAWTLSVKSNWIISKNFDFSIALSHLTLTSNNESVLPNWRGFWENNLIQGFFHFAPAISLKLSDKQIRLNSGIRFGTASPFGSARARESSNSLRSLHADIGLTNEFQFRINKKFLLGIEWIEGLSYYDYSSGLVDGTNDKYYSFFKYRTFQLTCEYEIHRN